MRYSLRILILAFAASALSLPAAAQAIPGPDYARPDAWLCRAGRADACSQPLTSTVVQPDGAAMARTTYEPDPAAKVDCFYVYPTVSQAKTGNADPAGGPEERQVAVRQFARFATVCRPFAPLYRQTTIAAMNGRAQGDAEQAYGDVLAAWRAYLARDNHGRGVVLIGHSQGAGLLMRLIAEQIDGKPVQRQLVSAVITGGDVQTPRGADVGGTFSHIGLCRSADQIGCVIAYSTFLASHPPGPGAYFGRSGKPGWMAACVDPAALAGRDRLRPALPTLGRVAQVLGTALVENPGTVSARCTEANGHSFLAITVEPSGPRAPALARALDDLALAAPDWGLHNMDVNLALGDLIEVVDLQAAAWTAAKR